MKTKLWLKLFCVSLFIGTYTAVFFPGCTPPADPDRPPPPAPNASLELRHQLGPLVAQGQPFNLDLFMDIEDGQLSTYDISITYNRSQLGQNITSDEQVVLPGADGFVNSVEVTQADTGETLRVRGTRTPGTGPGEQLQLLIINLIANPAATTGATEVLVRINELATDKGMAFSAPDSLSCSVTITEPAYFLLGGHVLDSIGGSPVAGALVSLTGNTGVVGQVSTDTQGYFAFGNTLIGVYELVVTKPGRAGSRLEQVYVTSDKIDWEIIQPLYYDRPEATVPPLITLNGLKREEQYGGLVPIEIFVRQGSSPVAGTNFHPSIFLKLGLTTMSYHEVAVSEGNSLSYLLNTALLPAGPINVKVVAYDINNNRSELNLPVFLAGSQGDKLPSVAPTKDDYYIVANTFGKSLNILRSRVYPQPEVPDPAPNPSLQLPDTTVLVEFDVARYYHGAAFYKSSTPDGEYTLIGQTTDYYSGVYTFFDYAPTLEPGTTVYYKIAYFNQYGTGPKTEAIPVRILPKFSLSLVGPANNSAVTGSTATLSWTCEPFLTGIQRTDWIIMYNTLDATLVVYSFVVDQTSYTVEDLFYNNRYEWNVRSVYEYINSTESSNAISRSYPGGQGAYDLSANGSFYFTVKAP